jgi:DsbC/DsbD-like thiol-disulfide interchange protein
VVRFGFRTAAAVAAFPFLVCAVAASPVAAQTAKKSPTAEDLVKVEMVASSTHVSPGKKLTLAVRFNIAPGWHIYWENPGEAGLATEVDFAAPAGYKVGPVHYPGPMRFQTPGETAASYGYSGTAILSAEVDVPAKVAGAEPLRFTADASWLACRDVCIRGKAGATVVLPAATPAKKGKPTNGELFARHRAELPRRFAELRVKPRWQRDERQVRLLISIKGDKAEYFPPTGEDMQLVSQATAADKIGQSELQLIYKPGFKPARARGVLAVTRGPDRRYYALDLEEAP